MYTCCTVVHHGCLFTPEKYPHLYICFNSQWIVIRHQENFSHYMFAPDNGAFFIGGRSSRIVSSANWPYFVDRPIGFDRTDGAQLPNQNTVESAIHRSRATSATSSSPAHRPATGHRKVAIPASFCCRPQRARSAAPDCIISPQRWRSVRQTAAAACPRPFSTNEIIISLQIRLADVIACRRNGRMIMVLFLKFGFAVSDDDADRQAAGLSAGPVLPFVTGSILRPVDRSPRLPKIETMRGSVPSQGVMLRGP